MAIRLKVAKTPDEIDDALWVRHEVFVVEDQRFGGKSVLGKRLLDRFDALPDVHNVIAYDGDEPIATIRLTTKESEVGLPADEYFDFAEYRKLVRAEFPGCNTKECVSEAASGADPVFGSAGMLAVRRPWRNRRDVIRTMYRVAAGVCRSSDVTHIVAVVNHRTTNMYRRLGFAPLSEKLWSNEIGDHVVPVVATAEDFCKWAFGDLPRTPLDVFKEDFERVFLRKGETIFSEGDRGHHAYIVGSGQVRISVKGNDGADLTLAGLQRGDLFGEFALIDEKPRSASAVAVMDCELITLDREAFHREVVNHPERILQLLEVFTTRMRRMDELMSTLVSSTNSKRLEFALSLARVWKIPDPKPAVKLVPGAELPQPAARNVPNEGTVTSILEEAGQTGELIYSNEPIRFVR